MAASLAAAAVRRHPVEVARGRPAVPGKAFGHCAANLLRAVDGHERGHAAAEATARHRAPNYPSGYCCVSSINDRLR
jgi:hypothetical protein